jgi:hypothetical protein
MTTLRHAVSRSSSGITLMEILISIMILGIGLISLATLFPIGLMRLREAQRQSRSAILLESAGADLATRGLLNSATFLNPSISPWYVTATSQYDPWIQDTPSFGGDWAGGGIGSAVGAYSGLGGLGTGKYVQTNSNVVNPPNVAISGPGLPVAYDPLWRYQTIHPTASPTQQGIAPNDSFVEARFGAGVGPLSGLIGAEGLQRLTNLQTIPNGTITFPTNIASIKQAFVSPEDVVWQDPTSTGSLNLVDPTKTAANMPTVANPSPVIPDLTEVVQQYNAVPTGLGYNNVSIPDWRYTWMFTGQKTDTFNGSIFDGSIVVFENRPFAVDPVSVGSVPYQVAGEPVVLAVFGYSGINATTPPPPAGVMSDTTRVYYGTSNNNVLLYWPVSVPDPNVKPGSWIADVTYVRLQYNDVTYFQFTGGVGTGAPPAQRCYWYQVNRVTAPADTIGSPYSAIVNGASYRYMFLSTSTPLKAKSLLILNASNQTVPYSGIGSTHQVVNAALVSPYVVNVIPRTFVVP